MNGRQIRLFLADGTAGGLTTAEIMNWSGHVIAASRSDLPSLLKRDEVGRTGVYMLLGSDNETGVEQIYIGEGDAVRKRLAKHAVEKEFWTRAVVISSKDLNLTKAHVRYLESRLIALAKAAARAKLDNNTAPEPISLPEADRSDMEYFIGQLQVLLPVLGVNALRPTRVASLSEVANDENALPADVSPPFFIKDEQGADATAHEVDGEFIVAEGSRVREWTGVELHKRKLRQQLEDEQVIDAAPDGTGLKLIQDYAFRSPSAAAVVVLGRTANGRAEWKLGDGTSYGTWQNDSLNQDVSAEPGDGEGESDG